MPGLAIAPRIASSLARCRPALHQAIFQRQGDQVHIFHDVSRSIFSSAHWLKSVELRQNPRTTPGPPAGHDTKPHPRPSIVAKKKKKHFNLNPAIHGKHAVEFGDENNIFIGSKMKPIKTTDFPDSHNPGNLNIAIADTHNYHDNHYQYLEHRVHPFFLPLTDLYVEKKRRDSLWITIRTAPRTCCILVARQADTKIRRALKQALWDFGYDYSGRRRKKGEPTTRDGEGNPKMSNHVELYGTVKIGAWDGVQIMHTDPRKLVQSLKGIIPLLEATMGLNEDGKFNSSTMPNYNFRRLDRTLGLEEVEKAKEEWLAKQEKEKEEFFALPEAPHIDRFGRTTGEASRTMAAALKNSQIETVRLLGEADLTEWAAGKVKKQGLKKKERRGFVSLLDVAGDLAKVAEEEINVKRPFGSFPARIEQQGAVLDVKPSPMTEDSFKLPDWWLAKKATAASNSTAALDAGANILKAAQAQVAKSAETLSETPTKPLPQIIGTPSGLGFGVAKREPQKAKPKKTPKAPPVPARPPMGVGSESPKVGSWGKPTVLPDWAQTGPVRFVPKPQAETEMTEENPNVLDSSHKYFGQRPNDIEQIPTETQEFPSHEENVSDFFEHDHEYSSQSSGGGGKPRRMRASLLDGALPPAEGSYEQLLKHDDRHVIQSRGEEKPRRKRISLLDTTLPPARGVHEKKQQWKRYSLDNAGVATPTEEIFPHDDRDKSNDQAGKWESASRSESSYRSKARKEKRSRSTGYSFLDTGLIEV